MREHGRAVHSLLVAMLLVGVALAGAWLVASSGLRASSGSIDVARPSFAPNASAAVDEPESSGGARAPVVDQAGMARTVTVRVVADEDRSALEGATVTVRATLRGVDAPVLERRTDATGSARLELAPCDEVTVQAGIAGREAVTQAYWTGSRPILHGRSSDRPMPAELELRLLARRTVLVRVVDSDGRELRIGDHGLDGPAALTVDLTVSSECNPVGTEHVSRGKTGQILRTSVGTVGTPDLPFRWQIVQWGSASACVELSVAGEIVATAPLETSGPSLVLRVREGAIERALAPIVVRVVDDVVRAPIVGARVALVRRELVPRAQSTDDEGRVRFAGPVDGRTSISVSAPGFGTVVRELPRPIDGEIVVELAGARRIEGVYLERSGAPVVNGTIELHVATADLERIEPVAARFAKSSRDGSFRFEDVPPGTYAIGMFGFVDESRSAEELPTPFHFTPVDCTRKDAVDLVVRRVDAPRPETRRTHASPRR